MHEEPVLITDAGAAYRARLRPGTPADRKALLTSWVPALESGPLRWLDREWPWQTFGDDDLHIEIRPEWLVLADEVESAASGELLGVLVTTGPVSAEAAGIGSLLEDKNVQLLWVEYIAIAPSLRPDCPEQRRRKPFLKVLGPQLMRAAVARSIALGLGGRIALHAEGEGARNTYTAKWKMRYAGDGTHRVGGAYPVCFGNMEWAAEFCSGMIAAGGKSP